MTGGGEPSIARRIVSFAIGPFLSLITPFLALPVIANATDAYGWAALAIGQSVGAVTGIVVSYGWPMVGPVEIARSDRTQVETIFYESLISRGLILAAVALPAAAISMLAAPTGYAALTIITTLASITVGLTFSWVAIGLGRARSMIGFDVLPRIAFTLLAAVMIAQGGSLYWYPTLIAAASFAGLLLFSVFVVRPHRPSQPLRTVLRDRLVGQASAAATAMAGSAYSAGALFLVGISTSVHQTALMSSADRLYRAGLFAVMALGNALQAWVVPRDQTLVADRRRRALIFHTGLGVVGLVGFAALAPTVSRALFGADLAFGYDVALAYGLTFAFLAPATSLAQHHLVPDGRVSAVMHATVLGAVVGVPALFLLAYQFGAAGGATGLALSELVVLTRLAWLVHISAPAHAAKLD